MNNENEIERMESIIIKHPLESYASAVELSEQGIGDKKQAVKEFAEKLKESFYNMDYFAIAIDNKIDDLIIELYGADE